MLSAFSSSWQAAHVSDETLVRLAYISGMALEKPSLLHFLQEEHREIEETTHQIQRDFPHHLPKRSCDLREIISFKILPVKFIFKLMLSFLALSLSPSNKSAFYCVFFSELHCAHWMKSNIIVPQSRSLGSPYLLMHANFSSIFICLAA